MKRLLTHKYPGPSTEAPSNAEESVLLITGGYVGVGNGGSLSSVEVYPSTSGCSPPALPTGRDEHTTFLTSEPNPVIATCGGEVVGRATTASCLVLDKSNHRWDESRMGDLTRPRRLSAVATLDSVGVFIIGGRATNNERTSNFLVAGQMQWQEGPALPVRMLRPCAVEITPTSFLSIHGTDIREFDVAIAGPTSSEGWREAGRWPALQTSRIYQPGCAKIGQKVIIAGGYKLSSTEVLDLVNRRITSGGEMATPRSYFHIVTIVAGGEEKMFALAGYDGSTRHNTVEEWVEENSTWKAADNLVEKRNSFGAVLAPRHLVC